MEPELKIVFERVLPKKKPALEILMVAKLNKEKLAKRREDPMKEDIEFECEVKQGKVLIPVPSFGGYIYEKGHSPKNSFRCEEEGIRERPSPTDALKVTDCVVINNGRVEIRQVRKPTDLSY